MTEKQQCEFEQLKAQQIILQNQLKELCRFVQQLSGLSGIQFPDSLRPLLTPEVKEAEVETELPRKKMKASDLIKRPALQKTPGGGYCISGSSDYESGEPKIPT